MEVGGRVTHYRLFQTGFSGKVARIWLGYRGPFQVCGQICFHWCLRCFSVIAVQALKSSSFAFFPPGDSRERRGLSSLCK